MRPPIRPADAHLGPATARRCRRRAAGSGRCRRAPGRATESEPPDRPVDRRRRARRAGRPTSDDAPAARPGSTPTKTRNGEGPGYGRPPRARRSMPCEPAPATRPIDRSDQPDDEQHDRRGVRPPDRSADDDDAEAEERRQPADDEQAGRRAALDRERARLPGRGGGPGRASASGSGSPAPVGRGQRSGSGSCAVRRRGWPRAAARPERSSGPTAGMAAVGRRGAGRDPAGRLTPTGRQRLEHRGRRPRAARSPCRTRRTATSPARPGGCSSGRRG